MIERSPDGPYYRVFVTGEADRIRSALAPTAEATGYRFDIEEVPRNYADLRALQDRLLTDPIDLGPSAQLLGAGLDVAHNVVAVDVVAVDDQAREALAIAHGADWLCIRPQGGPPVDVQPGGGAEDVLAVPTSDLTNMQAALMEGVLRADGTDCLWVEGAGRLPRSCGRLATARARRMKGSSWSMTPARWSLVRVTRSPSAVASPTVPSRLMPPSRRLPRIQVRAGPHVRSRAPASVGPWCADHQTAGQPPAVLTQDEPKDGEPRFVVAVPRRSPSG